MYKCNCLHARRKFVRVQRYCIEPETKNKKRSTRRQEKKKRTGCTIIIQTKSGDPVDICVCCKCSRTVGARRYPKFIKYSNCMSGYLLTGTYGQRGSVTGESHVTPLCQPIKKSTCFFKTKKTKKLRKLKKIDGTVFTCVTRYYNRYNKHPMSIKYVHGTFNFCTKLTYCMSLILYSTASVPKVQVRRFLTCRPLHHTSTFSNTHS